MEGPPASLDSNALTANPTSDGPQYQWKAFATKRAAVTNDHFVALKIQPLGRSAFPHQSFAQRNPDTSSAMASVLGAKFNR